MRRACLLSPLVLLLVLGPTLGQGIVVDEVEPTPVPDGRPVAFQSVFIKHHGIEAVVRQGVAETTIDQVFHNPNPRILEGTYIFPLPDSAAIGRFTMFMDGKEIEGEVLDAQRARGIYESIVRSQRDPGLLEYVGRKMIRARVFPIPAEGDVRIKIKYAQELTTEGGVTAYEYPLNSSKFSKQPLEEVTVSLDLESDIPLKSVYSPSHPVEVVRQGDHRAKIYYEGQNVAPNTDFKLYYQLSNKDFGLALLTHRPAGEDGYFLVMISPKEEYAADEIAPKDLTLVVDTSGSMLGPKMDQARAALTYCLDNLNGQDRFRLIRFSTDVEAFENEFAVANEDNLRRAKAWVAGIEARGGTNIMGALEESLAPESDPERLHLVVFVTDGKPTIGERDAAKIVENVSRKNAAGESIQKLRLHVFGVGDNLNTHLLDKLAEDNRGTRSYVGEKDDLDARVAGFYEKVASPVLSDLTLALGDVTIRDLYPKKLPDLFKGTQLVLFGRYRGEGDSALTLSGRIGVESRQFVYEGTFPAVEEGNEYLPRLWARRKVAFLMDAIRLHGETDEIKDEIVRLGKKYGIVTPYTSFLVLENGQTADEFEAQQGQQPRRPGLAAGGERGGRFREGADDAREFDGSNAAPGGGGASGPPASTEKNEAEEERRQNLEGYFKSMGGFGAKDKESGSEAVEHSKKLDELKQMDYLEDADERKAGLDRLIKKVEKKTFNWDGKAWVDTTFDAEKEMEAVEVEFMSDAYFALVKDQPGLAPYLSVGESVVLVLGGKVYRIVPPAAPQDQDQDQDQNDKD